MVRLWKDEEEARLPPTARPRGPPTRLKERLQGRHVDLWRKSNIKFGRVVEKREGESWGLPGFSRARVGSLLTRLALGPFPPPARMCESSVVCHSNQKRKRKCDHQPFMIFPAPSLVRSLQGKKNLPTCL